MDEAYAQALWKMVENGMAPKKAVDALYASLEARGRQGLMRSILRAFERLATRKRSENGVTLTVAREKDMAKALHAAKAALSSAGVGHTDVTESVDDSLIGGWRLEGMGMLIDESFKKQLVTLYNRSTRA